MLEENKKKQSIIKKIDYILIAFQIIIAVALGVKLFTMGVVPIIYLILYTIIILILNIGTFFSTKEHSCNYFCNNICFDNNRSSVWINCNRKIRHDIK